MPCQALLRRHSRDAPADGCHNERSTPQSAIHHANSPNRRHRDNGFDSSAHGSSVPPTSGHGGHAVPRFRIPRFERQRQHAPNTCNACDSHRSASDPSAAQVSTEPDNVNARHETPIRSGRQFAAEPPRFGLSRRQRSPPLRGAAPGPQPAQRPRSTAPVTSPTAVRCFPPRFQRTTSHCRPDDHVDVGLSDFPA